MEKRVIAAIALSIAILFVFQKYQERFIAKPSGPPAPQAAPEKSAPKSEPAAASPQAKTAEAPPVPASAEKAVDAYTVTVESELYTAVLDNKGGVLTRFQLKKYKSAGAKEFEMIPKFDTIPEADKNKRYYPGALIFDDKKLTRDANEENYVVETTPFQAGGSKLAAPAKVVMTLRRGSIEIEKTFQFEPDKYAVNIETVVKRGDDLLPGRLVLGEDICPEAEHLLNASYPLSAVASLAGKVQREPAPKEDGRIPRAGAVRWVGLEMGYFALVAVPEQALGGFDIERITGKSRNLIRVTIPSDSAGSLSLYIGPKNQADLAKVREDIVAVIDYGDWLGYIVKPLLIALRWLNRFLTITAWPSSCSPSA
jgi:YidC/Oxa1 family membrane protein insertase